jgi:hypothetical protein
MAAAHSGASDDRITRRRARSVSRWFSSAVSRGAISSLGSTQIES